MMYVHPGLYCPPSLTPLPGSRNAQRDPCVSIFLPKLWCGSSAGAVAVAVLTVCVQTDHEYITPIQGKNHLEIGTGMSHVKSDRC